MQQQQQEQPSWPLVVCRDRLEGAPCNPHCSLYIHPTPLRQLICIRCQSIKHMNGQNEVAAYKNLRRCTRKVLGIHSISVPLEDESTANLEEMASEFEISSNKDVVHVTLLEGLVPDSTLRSQYAAALKEIRNAMLAQPY